MQAATSLLCPKAVEVCAVLYGEGDFSMDCGIMFAVKASAALQGKWALPIRAICLAVMLKHPLRCKEMGG